MKKITVILVEGNRLLREGCASLLSSQRTISVVAALATSEKLLEKIQELKPAIVLLDSQIRGQHNLKIVQSITRNHRATKVIVTGLAPTQSGIVGLIGAGASGFLLRDAGLDVLMNTIESVAQGMQVLPPRLLGALFSEIADVCSDGLRSSILFPERMTGREKQVVRLVGDGLSNKEVAERLHISPNTIKTHIHNILEKLALRSRIQIAIYAYHKAAGKQNGGRWQPVESR